MRLSSTSSNRPCFSVWLSIPLMVNISYKRSRSINQSKNQTEYGKLTLRDVICYSTGKISPPAFSGRSNSERVTMYNRLLLRT